MQYVKANIAKTSICTVESGGHMVGNIWVLNLASFPDSPLSFFWSELGLIPRIPPLLFQGWKVLHMPMCEITHSMYLTVHERSLIILPSFSDERSDAIEKKATLKFITALQYAAFTNRHVNQQYRRNSAHKILIAHVPIQKWVPWKQEMRSCYATNSG